MRKSSTWVRVIGFAVVLCSPAAVAAQITYRSSPAGWQQHTSSGWQSASGDTSWADREQQARSEGEDRFNSFSQSGAGRWGGSAGWGDRSSGGWNDRFNGGFSSGGWNDRFNESGGRFGGYRR